MSIFEWLGTAVTTQVELKRELALADDVEVTHAPIKLIIHPS
jgi:hypothetical protein